MKVMNSIQTYNNVLNVKKFTKLLQYKLFVTKVISLIKIVILAFSLVMMVMMMENHLFSQVIVMKATT